MKSKDPSVQEVCSGCPLAEPFFELEAPRFQEGKQKECQSGSMLCPLSPEDDPSEDPEKSPSWRESVATSCPHEVMLAPHSTSSFLPGLFSPTAKFRLWGSWIALKGRLFLVCGGLRGMVAHS